MEEEVLTTVENNVRGSTVSLNELLWSVKIRTACVVL